MPTYQLTGASSQTFPTIVIAGEDADGELSYRTAELEPGEFITTNVKVDHAHLKPVAKTKAPKDTPHGVVRALDAAPVDQVDDESEPPAVPELEEQP